MRFLQVLNHTARRWMVSALYELRRTRRVIVTPESQPSCTAPIFVLGVHRSGTTLLRLILDSHPNIACPPESFFIIPLQDLLADKKAVEGLTAMGFDEPQVLRRLRDLVSHFFELYAASHNKRRWADKTPSYIDCLEFIERLYGPGSRYVVIHRHGLDVACSIAPKPIPDFEPHVRECGGDRFAGAARYWAVQTEKLLAFQAEHAARCIELRYEELSQNPEPNLRAMFEFLEEPWAPEVLRFYDTPHDQWGGLQDGTAADSRGFSPRIGTWREQPRDVVERMLQEAGPTLERLGYSANPAGEK